jgi:hypothetical protein
MDRKCWDDKEGIIFVVKDVDVGEEGYLKHHNNKQVIELGQCFPIACYCHVFFIFAQKLGNSTTKKLGRVVLRKSSGSGHGYSESRSIPQKLLSSCSETAAQDLFACEIDSSFACVPIQTCLPDTAHTVFCFRPATIARE